MSNKALLASLSVTEKKHIAFAGKDRHTHMHAHAHPHPPLHAQSWTIALAGQKVLEE